MANPKHLEILKHGVAAWNRRRKDNRGVTPELNGAALSGVNLGGADFSRADLSGADLSGADLSGANLVGADLSTADLSDADLNGADLGGADLNGANLIDANLGRANLSIAELGGAFLIGADLTEADLRGARGIEGASLLNACADRFTTWPINFDWGAAGVVTQEGAASEAHQRPEQVEEPPGSDSPAPLEKTSSVVTSPGEPSSSTNEISILVVEDDPKHTAILQALLDTSLTQATTRFVGSGRDARMYLLGGWPFEDRQRYPFPSLIVLDLGLPDSGGFEAGFEFLVWFKELERVSRIPVIVFTGSEDPEHAVRAYALGARRYMRKPDGFVMLVEAVKDELRQRFEWTSGSAAGDSAPAR